MPINRKVPGVSPAPREDDMKTLDLVVAAVVAVGLLGGAGAASAQQPSLAEVARQTAERRKAKDGESKAYTNEDLKRGRPVTVAGSAPEKPAEAAEPEAKPAADATAERVKELREYVAEREQEAQKLEQRIRDLNSGVLNSFDAAQREALVRDRDAALGDFRKVQLDVEAQKKAADDLEAKAAKPAPAKKPAQ
jgi:hypothetical protein